MLRTDLKTLYAIYDSNIPTDLIFGVIWRGYNVKKSIVSGNIN